MQDMHFADVMQGPATYGDVYINSAHPALSAGVKNNLGRYDDCAYRMLQAS